MAFRKPDPSILAEFDRNQQALIVARALIVRRRRAAMIAITASTRPIAPADRQMVSHFNDLASRFDAHGRLGGELETLFTEQAEVLERLSITLTGIELDAHEPVPVGSDADSLQAQPIAAGINPSSAPGVS